MAAPGAQVPPEGLLPKRPLDLRRDMLAGPAITYVGELLGAGAVGAATAVLVVVGDGRIVVASDPLDCPLPDQGHDLVGPGGVADEVPEMVDGTDIIALTPIVYIR
jgi:hypothetical protein